MQGQLSCSLQARQSGLLQREQLLMHSWQIHSWQPVHCVRHARQTVWSQQRQYDAQSSQYSFSQRQHQHRLSLLVTYPHS